jgi:hypothetical protein
MIDIPEQRIGVEAETVKTPEQLALDQLSIKVGDIIATIAVADPARVRINDDPEHPYVDTIVASPHGRNQLSRRVFDDDNTPNDYSFIDRGTTPPSVFGWVAGDDSFMESVGPEQTVRNTVEDIQALEATIAAVMENDIPIPKSHRIGSVLLNRGRGAIY